MIDPERGRAPAYLAPLLALIRTSGALRPGTVTHFRVEHDAWCSYFTVGLCDCRPDVMQVAAPAPGWSDERD